MSVDKFDKYVEKMHEDRDKLFEIEYEVNNFARIFIVKDHDNYHSNLVF